MFHRKNNHDTYKETEAWGGEAAFPRPPPFCTFLFSLNLTKPWEQRQERVTLTPFAGCNNYHAQRGNGLPKASQLTTLNLSLLAADPGGIQGTASGKAVSLLIVV